MLAAHCQLAITLQCVLYVVHVLIAQTKSIVLNTRDKQTTGVVPNSAAILCRSVTAVHET